MAGSKTHACKLGFKAGAPMGGGWDCRAAEGVVSHCRPAMDQEGPILEDLQTLSQLTLINTLSLLHFT